jgi:hypothetical protein
MILFLVYFFFFFLRIIDKILLESFQAKNIGYGSMNSLLGLDDAVNYPVEFLNSLNTSGFPPYLLALNLVLL